MRTGGTIKAIVYYRSHNHGNCSGLAYYHNHAVSYEYFFVEQSMGGETAAIVASSFKSLQTYLWFNIFLLCIVGFSAILINAKDDEFMHK